jgi:hypothetical protein
MIGRQSALPLFVWVGIIVPRTHSRLAYRGASGLLCAGRIASLLRTQSYLILFKRHSPQACRLGYLF